MKHYYLFFLLLVKIDFELVMSLVDLDEVVVAASFSERKKRAQASDTMACNRVACETQSS